MIFFKRFAARSEMMIAISLPSSSCLGLCLITVARDAAVLEKGREDEVTGCLRLRILCRGVGLGLTAASWKRHKRMKVDGSQER